MGKDEVVTLKAVMGEHLWEILREEGLLDALDNGMMRCYVTGVFLKRETVGGLVATPRGPRAIGESSAAYRRAGSEEFLKAVAVVLPAAMRVWRSERAACAVLARENMAGDSYLDRLEKGELDEVLGDIYAVGDLGEIPEVD